MSNYKLPKILHSHLLDLIEAVPEAIIVSKNGEPILYVNKSAETLFGYSKEELQGQAIEVLIPKKYRNAHEKYRKEYLMKPEAKTLDNRGGLYGLKKDNTEFPAKVMLGSLTIGKDVLILTIIQDVTSDIQINDKFNLFSTLINETTDAIEVVDTETSRFIDGNRTAWETLGYTREEFLLLHVQDIDPIVDLQKFQQLITKLKKEEEISIQSIHKRKDGSTFPVEINIKYVKLEKDYLISVVRDVTELKKAQDIIQHQAKYDSLTDLPNRNMLHDVLEEKLSRANKKRLISLLILNISRFKEINNTVGHHSGDQVLKQLAPRIKPILPNGENIFYISMDEFAIILNQSKEKTFLTVEKIFNILEEPFIIGDIPISVEVNIGVAFYPRHGTTTELLIQKAGIALDNAKQQGGCVLYHPKFDQYNPEHLTLMSELRTALVQKELALVYQPKINLKENRVTGLEALIRWNNPRRGLIMPNQFINLAEKTALITPLTLWTLEESLAQCLLWKKQGIQIPVSVNISPRNFLNRTFPERLATFLKNKAKNQVKFEFEITENTIMTDPTYAVSVIEKIQALGASFSIDDFGKDYSSLNYLKLLPVNTIKIDKSFIINMLQIENDIMIVQSIIHLAHNLGMQVIAEGVDSPTLLNKLEELGCDCAQGYFISRPMPPEAFNEWLKNSSYHL